MERESVCYDGGCRAGRLRPKTRFRRKHSPPKVKQRTQGNLASKLVLKVGVHTGKTPF